MSHWHRQKAKLLRAQLVEELGGCCVLCGATERLEFDHPEGRNWPKQPRAYDTFGRMQLYMREASLGLVRLLCRRCNACDGRRRQLEAKLAREPLLPLAGVEAPF